MSGSHLSTAPLRVKALRRIPKVYSLGASGGCRPQSASKARSTRSSSPKRAWRDMRALKSLMFRRPLASASEASKAAVGDAAATVAALRAVAALRTDALGLVDLARRLAAAPVALPSAPRPP